MDRVARRGPLAGAPGALKGGHSRNCQQLKGEPFGEKTNFRKKVSQCQKTERGTLWSRPAWYVTRKNRKNLFGSVR